MKNLKEILIRNLSTKDKIFNLSYALRYCLGGILVTTKSEPDFSFQINTIFFERNDLSIAGDDVKWKVCLINENGEKENLFCVDDIESFLSIENEVF